MVRLMKVVVLDRIASEHPLTWYGVSKATAGSRTTRRKRVQESGGVIFVLGEDRVQKYLGKDRMESGILNSKICIYIHSRPTSGDRRGEERAAAATRTLGQQQHDAVHQAPYATRHAEEAVGGPRHNETYSILEIRKSPITITSSATSADASSSRCLLLQLYRRRYQLQYDIHE
jgi:hypothetical protein